MILFLVVALICVAADEQVEDPKENCNCSRLFHEEANLTDPPPTFPTTSFTCWGRYDGYYADTEVDCTIFHYCQTWYFPTGLNETVKWDFACPQSTIFNQKILSCTPPNISFDCQESPNYYWVNWINSTESTTFAPTQAPEYSTPSSNIGQQLIVGGPQPQEANVSSSEISDNPSWGSGQPSHSETVQPQEDHILGSHEGSNVPGDAPESGQSSPPEPVQPHEDHILGSQEGPNVPGDASESDSGQSSQSDTVPIELINENEPEALHFPV